ncbi:hemolysin III [Rhodobacterales bacterium 52_120_T64]|nr:hemolysin III [Rhodobacterales bacterium 52_120_T64]
MQNIHSVFQNYTVSERVADGTMHILGVFGAILGAVFLAIWNVEHLSGGQTASLVIYSIAMIATFSASALYNMSPWERPRAVFRRLDHAAIYLKIAGTYTPLVVLIGSLSSYLVLAIVWGLAAFGVIRKLFFWRTSGKSGTILYLIMGWLSVILIWPLVPVLPIAATALIVGGGLTYTIGVIFYVWKALKFSRAIWHGFVLVASVCFYIAIALGTHSGGI